ncbi:tol-pal system protein YbgF [Oceanospirillum sediminis]|uniref:Cell division coordinator CpoB n=1 Tax=Oceanospirillum sediminis TaxID=2760088 RepID=A0A839ISW5_9GAMM|nr:tol-pal system protein YbgF [Oceanospirillum sediminis]MBB1488543.1 tol-pal system protein YbgF [Oceanospirillum sediminis]
MYIPFRKQILMLPVLAVSLSVNAADLAGQNIAPLGADSGSARSTPDVSSQLLFQVQQLQREVQMLRDHVEQQAQLINQLQRDSRDRYLDADRRLSDISREITVLRKRPVAPAAVNLPPAVNGPAQTPVSVAQVTTTASNDTQDQTVAAEAPASAQSSSSQVSAKEAYQSAYALVKTKQFDKAIESYRGFITTYQDSTLVPNAYYWLGELYLVKKQLQQAEQVFSTVVNSFPLSRKVPDASYKLGLIYARTGQEDKAKTQMGLVIKTYPDTTAAKLAANYLEQ